MTPEEMRQERIAACQEIARPMVVEAIRKMILTGEE